MESTNQNRFKKAQGRSLALEADSVLRSIKEEFDENHSAMDYFYDLFHQVYCEMKPVKRDKKVIGTMCIQAPEELIYAAGAEPVRLCNGSHTYEQVGAEQTSPRSCSLVNATAGFLGSDNASKKEEMEAVVIPITCDQKKKLVSILEKDGYNVIPLDIPSQKDSDAGMQYWHNTINEFALSLQKVTGKKITKKSLKDAIGKLNRARACMRKLTALRTESPTAILGKDVFLVTNAFFFDNIDSWIDAVEKLNVELEKKVADDYSAGNRHAPRILFTGTPPIFPNLKLPLLIEQLGGVIVADEVCSSSRLLHDAVTFSESNYFDMIPAIADRYIKPCTCPIFTRNDDRIRKLIELAKSSKANGVVYQAYSGCQLYSLEHQSVSEALAKEDIRMLYVETDYGFEDSGQLATRIEAFLESLKSKMKRSAK